MLRLKHSLKLGLQRSVSLLPDRLCELIVTRWLNKVARRVPLTPPDQNSLLLGFNLLLDQLVQDDPKAGLRSLLELDDHLTNCINQLAVKYDSGIHVKHRLTRYHDFFTERIQAGDRVVDIGCGTGSLAYDIAVKSAAIATGIDIRPASTQLARQCFQHPRLTFIDGDALTYPFNQQFDVVVLSNVLEHIEYRVEFLRRLQTHLQPEKILIRVPMFDRHWRVPLRQELGLFCFSDVTHYTEYTRDSFEQEIEAANLIIRHLQINWGEIWSEVTRQ
ncbi:class I SAM-dependent methyltransferase [bacterium]|nr:class I SAM-dependent methyltransferase [bacterium]